MDLPRLAAALAGRYDIRREIGTGGMATVYLANDLKHDRRVALKVLRPELGAVLGADRFLAEIKVTANLQHPNMLPLFDSGEADGLLYYVMPFVDGETLRHRIDREKQLPIDVALHVATSIATALDYAHRQGIVHRDLKPENILLLEGEPLVADFGIALAVSKAGGARVTQSGMTLGTPQYMSPEQAAGDRAIDGRSDIYSLGALLYEMLTGDPPHMGSTVQAIAAKVLTERPRSVRAGRESVSVQVASVVERALEKVPADRYSTAREFSEALRERQGAITTGARDAAHVGGVRSRWTPQIIALATIAVAASAVATFLWLRPPLAQPIEQSVRFFVTLPPGMELPSIYVPPAVSRDGRVILALGQRDGKLTLFRRHVDEPDLIRPVSGNWDNVLGPVISPDGRSIAFTDRALNQVLKIPIDGGEATVVADFASGVHGLDWSPSGMLVAGGSVEWPGIRVVPSGGGKLKPLTNPDTADFDYWPRVLPDSHTVVFIRRPKSDPALGTLAVTTLTSDTSESHVLNIPATTPLGLIDGYLVYATIGGSIMAVRFDMRSRKIEGEPIALTEQVSVNSSVGRARASLSETGVLVYLPKGTDLVSRTPGGVDEVMTTEPGSFELPRWSPDGNQIAMVVPAPRGRYVAILDVTSKAITPLTTQGNSTNPTWWRDRVVFIWSREGQTAVWWQKADRTETPEKLFDVPANLIVEALLAPDGNTLIYRGQAGFTAVEIRKKDSPRSLVDAGFHAALSGDGKLLAYSDYSGGIAVKSLDGPGVVTQVARKGSDPVWSIDGKRLYYRNNLEMMVADLSTAPELRSGDPRKVFEGPYLGQGGGGPASVSISPIGEKLLLLRQSERNSRLAVTTNLANELRERAGAAPR